MCFLNFAASGWRVRERRGEFWPTNSWRIVHCGISRSGSDSNRANGSAQESLRFYDPRLMEAGRAEGKSRRTPKCGIANQSTNSGRTDHAGSQSTLRIRWLWVSSEIYGFLFRDGLPEKSEIAPGK
jgi:hypothetical protein